MEIHGLNKTTLLDYPEHVACTVFSGHCNFRCPFCQNGELVLNPASQPTISEEEFFGFLHKRHAILDGVCVTGGEPTLQKDLRAFISRIKEMGLLVKLDTNGSHPELIASLYEEHLIDYVAMDIKSSPKHYGMAVGLDDFDIAPIQESVSYLMNSGISYEFRTTVVSELHTKADFESIAEWIGGCKAYYLQSYTESDGILLYRLPKEANMRYPDGLHPYLPGELKAFAKYLCEHNVPTKVRGVE